jgi:hypothetical protein
MWIVLMLRDQRGSRHAEAEHRHGGHNRPARLLHSPSVSIPIHDPAPFMILAPTMFLALPSAIAIADHPNSDRP